MWDKSDKDAFYYHTNTSKMGQITMDSNLGKLLFDFASDSSYKRFFESGTWNGLGSTLCFHKGFQSRSSLLGEDAKDDFFLDSLEINREKAESAISHYKDITNIRIHHATLVKHLSEGMTWEYIVKKLEIKPSDYGIKQWFDTDTNNLSDCPIFQPLHSMDDQGYLYDVVFLDGGEFTTLDEFEILCNISKVMICDDINTYKCAKIYKALVLDERWTSLVYEPNDRNGYCVFMRK